MSARSCVCASVAAWLIAAAPGLVSAQAPATGPLTLRDATQRAVEANPSIAAARLARAVSVAGVGVAGERPNPELTFDWERETPRQAITGTFPIELAGKRGARLNLAHAAVATSEAEVARLIAAVRADVRQAYYGAVAADRRLAIAEDLRTLAVRTRDASRARFNAGDVPEMEVVQTELVVINTENEVTGARGEVTATRAALNALLGQPATTVLTLADDFMTTELPSADAAVAQALGGNAELALLDRRIAEQQMRRALAQSLRRSDLTAGAALTYDAEPEFRFGWRVNFGVTVPVFTTHRAAVEVEDAELARLRAERGALASKVGADIVAAVAKASAAREQLERYQNDSLPRVQTLERMAQDSYNSGQTGLPVLLQALQQTREVRQRALQAGLDFQSAMADLERAMGVGR